LIKIF